MKEYLKNIIHTIIDSPSNPQEKSKRIRDLHDSSNDESDKKVLDCVIHLLSDLELPIRPEEDFYFSAIVDGDAILFLSELIGRTSCTFFNATCGELLWMKTHKKEYADLSMKSYWAEMRFPTYDDDLFFTKSALGVCRIFSKYSSEQFPFEEFYAICEDYIKVHLDDDGFCSLYIAEGLVNCNQKVPELEAFFVFAVDHFSGIRNYIKEIAYVKFLEDFYRRRGKRAETQKMIRRLALAHENQAKQYDWSNAKDAFTIIHEIHKAMDEWQRTNDSDAADNRKRLAQLINPIKKQSIENMQILKSGEINIGVITEKYKTDIQNYSFEQVIRSLIFLIKWENPNEIENELRESGSFSNFFPKTILDKEGRIKCIVPSVIDASPEEVLSILEDKAKFNYSIGTALVYRCLLIAKEKCDFTEENLKLLVESSIFIPPDRQRSFLKGLRTGFDEDYISSLSILMPQVENAIRCLAEKCGAVVYKTEKNGTEESLSLESILKLPEVSDCLDETLLFNLRVFYTSVYGFGMRNAISHGFLSDAEVNSTEGMAVWLFTLYLCCIFSPEFLSRISKQKELSDFSAT